MPRSPCAQLNAPGNRCHRQPSISGDVIGDVVQYPDESFGAVPGGCLAQTVYQSTILFD